MKNMLFAVLFAGLAASQAWAVVDLNSATPSQLESVKGIGPAKAKAIAEYRDKHGAFKSLDELANVKGFGKASVAKFKGELSVDGKVDDKPKTKAK